MSGLLSYSGVTTKIRAMSKNFITENGFREIVSLPNVPAVVTYLKKDPAYTNVLASLDENSLHRGTIEFLIGNSIYYDFQNIYNFCNPKQRLFLKAYARRYEVKLLKRSLSHAIIGEPMEERVLTFRDFFNNYSALNIDALYAATNVEQVIAAVAETPYYAILSKVHQKPDATLFDYETVLDLYHFSAIWKDRDKIVAKGSVDIITKAYGSKFDMLNLWYIHRARTYYDFSEVDTYALTIPVLYKLKKEDIKALVTAETDDQFKASLEKTYYGKHYKNLTPSNLEDMYTFVCKNVLSREAKEKPYSVASLYNYLYWKEHEIYRLTIAIECVRYGIAPDEAMKYVTLV
ncbi:MAG TPA: V-type ATPase subunit [Lachnospiraceae bacterium]|nr:V-type ATPase subunit [Lachnospiraceae bacterium]